jgi:hypothetical protein
MEPWKTVNATMEAWRLKIKPWRVCTPVVADSRHRIRIRIEVKVGSNNYGTNNYDETAFT